MIVGSSPTPRATPLVRAEKLLAETTARATDVTRIGNEILSGDIGEARSLSGHLNVLSDKLNDLAGVSARAGGRNAATAIDQMSEALRPVARAAVFPAGMKHQPLTHLHEIGAAASSIGNNIAATLATLTAAQLLRPDHEDAPKPDDGAPPASAPPTEDVYAGPIAAAEAQAAAAAAAAAAPAAEAPVDGPIADDGIGFAAPADEGAGEPGPAA